MSANQYFELRCKGTHFIGNLQNFDLKMIVNFNI